LFQALLQNLSTSKDVAALPPISAKSVYSWRFFVGLGPEPFQQQADFGGIVIVEPLVVGERGVARAVQDRGATPPRGAATSSWPKATRRKPIRFTGTFTASLLPRAQPPPAEPRATSWTAR